MISRPSDYEKSVLTSCPERWAISCKSATGTILIFGGPGDKLITLLVLVPQTLVHGPCSVWNLSTLHITKESTFCLIILSSRAMQTQICIQYTVCYTGAKLLYSAKSSLHASLSLSLSMTRKSGDLFLITVCTEQTIVTASTTLHTVIVGHSWPKK